MTRWEAVGGGEVLLNGAVGGGEDLDGVTERLGKGWCMALEATIATCEHAVMVGL